MQNYTADRLNSRLDGNGNLLIEARRAAGYPFAVREMDAAAFDKALTDIYAYEGLKDDGLGSEDDAEDLSRIIDEIPKNPSGKILRRALREID